MPIVLPPPGGEEIDVSEETRVNRELTHAFIMSDPMEIQLIPYLDVRQPSGGMVPTAQPARETQTFRLIPMSSADRPRTSSSAAVAADEGVQRRYEYTLLGEWNCLMSEKDQWTTPDGQVLVIDSIVSNNGYERKGMITSYGRKPEHG